jgi:ribosome-associated translation inhibitor RaiA
MFHAQATEISEEKRKFAGFIDAKIRQQLLFREHAVADIAASETPSGVHMDLQFRSPDPEGALWHQRSLARLRRALRRLHGAVAQVRVQLEDTNGPEGGVDKRCRVEVAVPGQAPVAVTATARSWQASIDAAATVLRQRLISRSARSSASKAATPRPLPHRPAVVRTPLRLQTAG